MQISMDFQSGIKGLVWKSRKCWKENVWERINAIQFCTVFVSALYLRKIMHTTKIHSHQIKEENRKFQANQSSI